MTNKNFDAHAGQMEKTKCLFCSKDAVPVDMFSGIYAIFCDSCGAIVSFRGQETKKESIAAYRNAFTARKLDACTKDFEKFIADWSSHNACTYCDKEKYRSDPNFNCYACKFRWKGRDEA